MNNVEKTIEHAERQCKEHGARLTTKRRQVLSGLLQTQKALSAYELIDYCNSHFEESFPAMSVYRILEFLEGENLVHKLNLSNKYVACSHITCDHEHKVPQFLICRECNIVKEIRISKSAIDELDQNVHEAGFRLLSQQLEMNCICEQCLDSAA